MLTVLVVDDGRDITRYNTDQATILSTTQSLLRDVGGPLQSSLIRRV